MNTEKNFALIDCSTSENATDVLAYMDGTLFKNKFLRVRRPKDFIPLNRADHDIRLRERIARTSFSCLSTFAVQCEVFDGPFKLFIGNLNHRFRKDELLDCLWSLAEVKFLRLEQYFKQESGHAFLEFEDSQISMKALVVLNGLSIAGSFWLIDRHIRLEDYKENPNYSIPQSAVKLLNSKGKILEIGGIIKNIQYLNENERQLRNYKKDVKTECARFGRVKIANISTLIKEKMTATKKCLFPTK